MSESKKKISGLSAGEKNYLVGKVAAETLVYGQHDVLGHLLPHERKRLRFLRRLCDRLSKAEEVK